MLKYHKLDNFTRGWLVGHFDPSIIKTDQFEVAVKHFKAGETEKRHYHKLTTELTIVISGCVEMGGNKYNANDIIELEPNTSCDFKCLEDATVVAVRNGSYPGDKYIVD